LEDVGRRPSTHRCRPFSASFYIFVVVRLLFQQRACQATPWIAKLYKSAPGTTRHSEKRSDHFLLTIVFRGTQFLVPIHEAQFAKGVLEGGRFTMWQLYRSASGGSREPLQM
jgi:hypothetical protein